MTKQSKGRTVVKSKSRVSARATKKVGDKVVKTKVVKKVAKVSSPDKRFYPYVVAKHGDFAWQYKRFESLLKSFDAKEKEVILKAYAFANEKHKGQARSDGSAYIIHPVRIANILMGEWKESDFEIVSAALLHDVIEDTQTTIRELKDAFGARISQLTDGMTMWKGSETPEVYLTRISRGKEDLRRIKCADALDNLRSWHECPKDIEDRFPRWWRQTRQYVIPIADDTLKPASKILREMIEDDWYLEKAGMM